MLGQFKQKIKGLTLAPYADGRFEVIVGGRRIWSKLETGEFPDEKAMLKALARGG